MEEELAGGGVFVVEVEGVGEAREVGRGLALLLRFDPKPKFLKRELIAAIDWRKEQAFEVDEVGCDKRVCERRKKENFGRRYEVTRTSGICSGWTGGEIWHSVL